MSAAQAAFPGRNGLIVFGVGRDRVTDMSPYPFLDNWNLFTLRPDNGAVREIRDEPEFDFDPRWSPDGKSIAFARALRYPVAADIYAINSDGSDPRNLTASPTNDDYMPEWSPDGSEIVFTSSINDVAIVNRRPHTNVPGPTDTDLYVVGSDGTGLRPLVRAPGNQFAPAWSPDGRWIAFSDLATNSIGLISPDGSERRTLLDDFRAVPWRVNWSPNGSWIAFDGLRSRSAWRDIWIVRPDGSGLTNLTWRSNSNDHNPAWSPDGMKIAFVSDRDDANTLFVMRVDGTHVRKLIDIELAEAAPDWGPRP